MRTSSLLPCGPLCYSCPWDLEVDFSRHQPCSLSSAPHPVCSLIYNVQESILLRSYSTKSQLRTVSNCQLLSLPEPGESTGQTLHHGISSQLLRTRRIHSANITPWNSALAAQNLHNLRCQHYTIKPLLSLSELVEINPPSFLKSMILDFKCIFKIYCLLCVYVCPHACACVHVPEHVCRGQRATCGSEVPSSTM